MDNNNLDTENIKDIEKQREGSDSITIILIVIIIFYVLIKDLFVVHRIN